MSQFFKTFLSTIWYAAKNILDGMGRKNGNWFYQTYKELLKIL